MHIKIYGYGLINLRSIQRRYMNAFINAFWGQIFNYYKTFCIDEY